MHFRLWWVSLSSDVHLISTRVSHLTYTGHEFNRFLRTCGDLLAAFDPIHMPLYEEFATSCAQLDPRSLAWAIHYARCDACGDNDVDGLAGEECDGGEMNGRGTCSTECKIQEIPSTPCCSTFCTTEGPATGRRRTENLAHTARRRTQELNLEQVHALASVNRSVLYPTSVSPAR